jgi:hypothetical protein
MIRLFRRSGRSRPTKSPRLRVERLEARDVPAVFYHGGALLTHAQLSTVYYGQDWPNNFGNALDAAALDQFYKNILPSSYMSMLGEYGVGKGGFVGHDVVSGGGSPAANTTVTEAGIQGMLSTELQSGRLPESTGSQLFMVYLPPNVKSQFDVTNSAYAHHNSFQMWFTHSVQTPIGRIVWQTLDNVYYGVVPHPTGNFTISGLNFFQQQTEVSSHELTEAVTDPRVWQDAAGWHGTGWHAGAVGGNALGQEIGDLANLNYVTNFTFGFSLNPTYYTVQKEWSNYHNAAYLPPLDSSWYLPQSPLTPTSILPNIIHLAASGSTHERYVAIGTDGRFYVNWVLGANDYSGWSVA